MPFRFLTPCLVSMVCLLAIPGCGGKSAEEEMSQAENVNSTIYSIADYAGREDGLKEILASGNNLPLEEHKKYGKVQFDIIGDPSISGDTATVTVMVKEFTGQELGEQQWTLVKEGEHWRLKDIPLP